MVSLSRQRQPEAKAMIYEVTVQAPAINEVVTTEADNEEQAKERAVASALARQAEAATVTVKRVPMRDV
jgi:hypothetical protein